MIMFSPKKLLLIIKSLGLLTLSIFHQTAWAGDYSGLGKITGLYMAANGSFMRINVQAATVNPGHCGGADYYIVELNTPQQDRFVSTVMSAFLAGKPVNFWIDGCTAGTYWGVTRPVPVDIYVYP